MKKTTRNEEKKTRRYEESKEGRNKKKSERLKTSVVILRFTHYCIYYKGKVEKP